jgi:hypothetical protein
LPSLPRAIAERRAIGMQQVLAPRRDAAVRF